MKNYLVTLLNIYSGEISNIIVRAVNTEHSRLIANSRSEIDYVVLSSDLVEETK